MVEQEFIRDSCYFYKNLKNAFESGSALIKLMTFMAVDKASLPSRIQGCRRVCCWCEACPWEASFLMKQQDEMSYQAPQGLIQVQNMTVFFGIKYCYHFQTVHSLCSFQSDSRYKNSSWMASACVQETGGGSLRHGERGGETHLTQVPFPAGQM